MTNLSAAEKLAALYNNAEQVGNGILRERGREPMTVEEAQQLLALRTRGYVDYLHGREMKVDVLDDKEDGRLYDRAYGAGAYHYVLMMAASTGTVGKFTKEK